MPAVRSLVAAFLLWILRSDLGTLLALLAAVLGLLNILYTRKSFRIAHHPVLQLCTDAYGQLRVSEFWPCTHLRCEFTNQSTGVSISDICATVLLARAGHGLRRWCPRWIQWCDLRSLSFLAPTKSDVATTEDVYPDGLEQFLTVEDDSVLERDTRYPQGSPEGAGYYLVRDQRPVKVRMRVEYRAGLPGARTQTLSLDYQLTAEHGCRDRGSLKGIDLLQGWSLRQL